MLWKLHGCGRLSVCGLCVVFMQGLAVSTMPYALYIASALGAAAVFMMTPRRTFSPRLLGALLGAVTLGGLWLYLATHVLADPSQRALAGAPMVYYYVFSAIAIVAAVRVITHQKPVYAALWFVMVVLATAGLLLVLDAEFMAVAMVIIYGGAILVTYVFVIMLASHAGDPAGDTDATDYDRAAREPAAATCAGFLLLAVLLSAAFVPTDRPWAVANPAAAAVTDAELIATVLTDRPANRVIDKLDDDERALLADTMVPVNRIDNAEHIGYDLFTGHPLGIELAGVILLVSLVGAVVIARTYVPPRGDEAEPS